MQNANEAEYETLMKRMHVSDAWSMVAKCLANWSDALEGH